MCGAIIVGFLVGVIAVALGVPLWAILILWLLKQSSPEGVGILPVALCGMVRHFSFLLFKGFHVLLLSPSQVNLIVSYEAICILSNTVSKVKAFLLRKKGEIFAPPAFFFRKEDFSVLVLPKVDFLLLTKIFFV